jgi:tyrosyl-tRNA synthetase
MGGSDQWGNIINGIDLGRRMHNAQFFALTSPLITTASGAKMGKTAAGAVWLDPTMTSQHEFWQYWRNVEDADVPRFLKLFTRLPLGEIDRLAALRDREINEAKKILATEVTALVYDDRALAQAMQESARTTFEEGGLGASLPIVELPRDEFRAGLGVLAAFVKAGLAASNGEARRAIANNALMVNDIRVASDKAAISEADVTADGVVKLSLGRKRHVLLKPV